MSINYSLDAYLAVKYSEENIEKILSRGKKLNFIYYKEYFEEIINSSEALQIILHCPKDEASFVSTKSQDTLFSLHFEKDSGSLRIGIALPSNCWKKERNNTGYYDIDIARYLRLLSELCNQFKVIKFEVSTF